MNVRAKILGTATLLACGAALAPGAAGPAGAYDVTCRQQITYDARPNLAGRYGVIAQCRYEPGDYIQVRATCRRDADGKAISTVTGGRFFSRPSGGPGSYVECLRGTYPANATARVG